ncbi:MAG: extracellular solute-binding protein [Clostridiales bacterium]|nr:extracellular solute-binding protein [Clostridiales bacterium]
MLKRATTLILLAALLISTIASCGSNDTPNDNKDSSDTETNDSTSADTTPMETLDLPSDLNYDGYTFRILSRPDGRLDEILAETETGDVLNDAVYKRNSIVEEKLNIKFEISQSSADWETDALNSILASDDAYDVVLPAARAAFIYAQNLVCTNWYDIPNVDLSKSWWNQDVTSLAINGKLYACAGDISHGTLKGSIGMVFNKQLLDDYQIEYPYELVTEGKWTFDEFSKMVTNFSQDLNNDGQMKIEDDLFGYGSNHWCGPINALYCTGERIITVDKDGYPQLTLYSEKVVDMYDKYMKLILSESGWNQLAGNTHHQAFCDGRMAMVDIGMGDIASGMFREATVDFGLVPWPKSDESVDKYYSYVDAGQTLWIVPITNQDLERTGAILETMAYYGQKEIIPAFYDIALQNKYLRDDMSVQMLDYIKDGGVFDLGYYNNTQFGGGLANPGYDLVHDTTLSFTTLYSRNEQSVKTLIENSMKIYLED